MDTKIEFETLLLPCKNAVERFIYYKMPTRQDGEDLLQELYLTAYQKLDSLADKTKFKSWILSIATNKCNDFYRARMKCLVIPIEYVKSYKLFNTRVGIGVKEIVDETLQKLADKDKQILYLFYYRNLSQKDISVKLNIPIGTVKSRLSTAKQNFKNKYPYPPILKGENIMKKLPDIMPEVQITTVAKPIFEVKWEELMGWFIVPKLGEKLSWAMYDYPQKNKTEVYDLSVTQTSQIHGIDCVEIKATDQTTNKVERTLYATITDTYTRYLADIHYHDEKKVFCTFLDDDWLKNWGFGENNCGNEIYPKQKKIIIKDGNIVTAKETNVIDVVGRYDVKIGDKIYDTILIINIDSYNNGVMCETYLDKNGHTILWRRFNKDDWAINRYEKLWSEQLPTNEKVTINDETYVHWYSCITDYVV